MGRLFYLLGGTFLLLGVMWTFGEKIGLHRLPGDLKFQKGNVTYYFPIGTCIALSLGLSFIMWLFNRMRGP